MNRQLNWGILATGGIAHAFARDLTDAGFRIAAVGSRRADAAVAFAEEFGIPTAHGSYEELVADPGVDVIYVATPHPMHVRDAVLAIDAGKHVLIEKPVALNAAEAQLIADRAADEGVIAMEAMWTRYLPHMVRIREILAAGTLGEVRTVLADHTQNLPTNPEHRLQNPDLGGGALLDLGIYPVSFAVDVLGLPAGIRAHASMTPTGVDRQTAMIFDYEDGRQAVLHTALDTAGPNRAAIIGTEGAIEIDRTFYVPTPFTHYDRDWNVVEHFEQPVATRGMHFQAAELEARVAGDAPSSLPFTESIAIMGLLDEVRRQIGLVYPSERGQTT